MGPYGFPVCSLNAHAQSTFWATDMSFVPEVSTRSLLHACEQERSGETALMRRFA